MMDAEYLEKPRKWEADSIARFMIFIGPISSIFDYVTFAVMYFYLIPLMVRWHTGTHTAMPASYPEHLFQSGWFIEGLLSQTLIIHMIRTRKIPFIQSWATAPVIALTTAIMAIGVALPFTPFASAFDMVPLPWQYFPILITILVAYCALTQVVKVWYIKKFEVWL
jgi:Mg2+-importing ATPase